MKRKIMAMLLAASLLLSGCGISTNSGVVREKEAEKKNDKVETVINDKSAFVITDKKGKAKYVLASKTEYGYNPTVWTYEYDDDFNPVRVSSVDENGNLTEYVKEYDKNGFAIASSLNAVSADKEKKLSIFLYDDVVTNMDNDSLLALIFSAMMGGSKSITNEYDKKGNLTKRIYSGGITSTVEEVYTYDGNGRLRYIDFYDGSSSGYAAREELMYDDNNLLVSMSLYEEPGFDKMEFASTFSYDSMGNPSCEITTLGDSSYVRYYYNYYDENGLLSTTYSYGGYMGKPSLVGYTYKDAETGEIVSEPHGTYAGYDITSREYMYSFEANRESEKKKAFQAATGLSVKDYLYGDFDGDMREEMVAFVQRKDGYDYYHDMYYVDENNNCELIKSFYVLDKNDCFSYSVVQVGRKAYIRTYAMDDPFMGTEEFWYVSDGGIDALKINGRLNNLRVGCNGETYATIDVSTGIKSPEGRKLYGLNTWAHFPVTVENNVASLRTFSELSERALKACDNYEEAILAAEEKICELSYFGIQGSWDVEVKSASPVEYLVSDNIVYVNFDVIFDSPYEFYVTESSDWDAEYYPVLFRDGHMNATAEFQVIAGKMNLNFVRFGKVNSGDNPTE